MTRDERRRDAGRDVAMLRFETRENVQKLSTQILMLFFFFFFKIAYFYRQQ